jgi:anti-sigma-K factor RskA
VAALAIVKLLIWNVTLRAENEDLRGEVQNRQIYELQGPGAAGYVRGEVVELGNGRAVLIADGLPAPSEGEAYEAWLLRDGVPEPAGLFESHHGAAAMPVEDSIEGADAVAVTVEPSGDSSVPTSEPLLTANL